MTPIPDDPIISCMEHTGYPPWMLPEEPEPEEDPDMELWYEIMSQLEAYGTPCKPFSREELPPHLQIESQEVSHV